MLFPRIITYALDEKQIYLISSIFHAVQLFGGPILEYKRTNTKPSSQDIALSLMSVSTDLVLIGSITVLNKIHSTIRC